MSCLELQKNLIKEKYPHAIFVHCHSGILNLVLQQSVKNIKECTNFVIILLELVYFFLRLLKGLLL